MDTKKWGPHAWILFHSTAFNYPEKPTKIDKFHFKTFFINLAFTLPCKFCRESYTKFLQELPIDDYLNSRKNLALWSYKMHNKVNNKLRKQGNKIPKNPTFKEVCNYYESFRATCSSATKTCRRTSKNPVKKGKQVNPVISFKGKTIQIKNNKLPQSSPRKFKKKSPRRK